MAHRRHWKQRWDPAAEFVFTRRMRLGSEGEPWVPAGTVVDKVRYARKLHVWWRLNLIAIKDWRAPVVSSAPAEVPGVPDEETLGVPPYGVEPEAPAQKQSKKRKKE